MKAIAFIERKGVTVYKAALVLAVAFNLLGFEIIEPVVILVFNVSYFIILLCAMGSFYKSKKTNKQYISLFFLPVVLLFTGIPFKIITLILVLPLFFVKENKSEIRGVGIFLYALSILIGICGIVIKNGPPIWVSAENTVVDEQYSPNGVFRAVTIDSDQGALGGDTYVKSEAIFFHTVKWHIKTLYKGSCGEKPEIQWVDNSIVRINGRDMNIFFSSAWGPAS